MSQSEQKVDPEIEETVEEEQEETEEAEVEEEEGEEAAPEEGEEEVEEEEEENEEKEQPSEEKKEVAEAVETQEEEHEIPEEEEAEEEAEDNETVEIEENEKPEGKSTADTKTTEEESKATVTAPNKVAPPKSPVAKPETSSEKLKSATPQAKANVNNKADGKGNDPKPAQVAPIKKSTDAEAPSAKVAPKSKHIPTATGTSKSVVQPVALTKVAPKIAKDMPETSKASPKPSPKPLTQSTTAPAETKVAETKSDVKQKTVEAPPTKTTQPTAASPSTSKVMDKLQAPTATANPVDAQSIMKFSSIKDGEFPMSKHGSKDKNAFETLLMPENVRSLSEANPFLKEYLAGLETFYKKQYEDTKALNSRLRAAAQESAIEAEDLSKVRDALRSDLDAAESAAAKLRHEIKDLTQQLQTVKKESQRVTVVEAPSVTNQLQTRIATMERERAELESQNRKLAQQNQRLASPDTANYINLEVQNQLLLHMLKQLQATPGVVSAPAQVGTVRPQKSSSQSSPVGGQQTQGGRVPF